MDISLFQFLTDENIDPDVAGWLREKGFDVKDIKEEQLHGVSDDFILDLANGENRIIITHDSDFGKIVFAGYPLKTGIIFLRPGHIDSQVHIISLTAVFDSISETTFPFIVVAENSGSRIRIRIRSL